MKDRINFFIHALLACFPCRIKIFIYNRFMGYEISSSAYIGFSVLMAKKVKIGPQCKVRHGNIIRGLELFELGEGSTVGNFNQFSALPMRAQKHFAEERGRFPAFILGRQSSIVKKHFFDCNNTVTIGNFTTVSGTGSVFFTHSINIEKNRQESNRIQIGQYCMIAARCVVTKGAVLPDCSILAANSTLHKAFEEPYTLYSGVPAAPVKSLDRDSAYFKRNKGYVD